MLREIAAFTFRALANTALKMEARFLACTARSLYQLPYPRLVKAKESFGNSGIWQRAREERFATVATSKSRTLNGQVSCVCSTARQVPTRCGRMVRPRSAQCHSWQADAIAQRQAIRKNEHRPSLPAAAYVSMAY